MTEFTKVRKGYRPEQVEQELSRLKQKIAEQEEELAVYNKREEEVHRNEIEAQMKADLIIEEAQRKADEIQKNAREELKEIRQEALRMRDLMEAFQNEYNQLLRQYLLKIRTDEFSALMDRLGCLIEKTGGEYPYKEE